MNAARDRSARSRLIANAVLTLGLIMTLAILAVFVRAFA